MSQTQLEKIQEAFFGTPFAYVIEASKNFNPSQRKRVLELIPQIDLSKNVRQRYVNMKDKALVEATLAKINQEISIANAVSERRRIRYIRSFARKAA